MRLLVGAWQSRPGKWIHGGRATPEYTNWCQMKSRCLNEHNQAYCDYGGRGITICERWMRFENFIADIGHRPTPKHQLDRVNNDGNYDPGNCRWALCKEQCRNRRSTRFITFNGVTKVLFEWGEDSGIGGKILWQRLNRGWTIERAMTEVKRKAIK